MNQKNNQQPPPKKPEAPPKVDVNPPPLKVTREGDESKKVRKTLNG